MFFNPPKLDTQQMNASDFELAAIACEVAYPKEKYWDQPYTAEDAMNGYMYYKKPPLNRIALKVMHNQNSNLNIPPVMIASCVSAMIPRGEGLRVIKEYTGLMASKPIGGMIPGKSFNDSIVELDAKLNDDEPFLLIGDVVKIAPGPSCLYPLIGATINDPEFLKLNPKNALALVKGGRGLHRQLTFGGQLALAEEVQSFPIDLPSNDRPLSPGRQFIQLLKINLNSLPFNILREHYGY